MRQRGQAQFVASCARRTGRCPAGRPTALPRAASASALRARSSQPAGCGFATAMRESASAQPRRVAWIRLAGSRRGRRPLRYMLVSCFQKRTMSASKMMSASRISPVSGLARDGPMAKPRSVVIQRKVL